MTKFYNYLNEISTDRKEYIKRIIERDCQPFLKEWDKLGINLLYIGKYDSVSGILKKQTRQNRRPLDTPKEAHNIVDNWFKDKFGVKARSNAIFTSFYYSQAADYGNPYLVFPIGKFIAISSYNINDLFDELDRFTRKILMNQYIITFGIKQVFTDRSDISLEIKNKIIDKIIEFLEKANYKKGLQKHKNEQMIICKEYYLVDITNENYLYNELEIK